MHRIHSYPAKFPAFITTKALEYANYQGRRVKSIADIFCGCGTTAIEARRNNISFWGCDINPVATLIAQTKSRRYQSKRLSKYHASIIEHFNMEPISDNFLSGNERLRYWYKREQYNELAHLKSIILRQTPKGSDYQLFFLCAFSNILKATSVWLAKSIKPQVDPVKKCANVLDSFKKQCERMFIANAEMSECCNNVPEIVTENFLADITKRPRVDMIITSPPYVTSYEYADLHQLSSLWLGFTSDYRKLRDGTIGSLHHDYNFNREWKRLNNSGNKIVSLLLDKDKSKAHSVAKYFLDMQVMAKKAYAMLNNKGTALFVIGNTEYKGVRVNNAKHLAESLLDAGFSDLRTTKRKISNKILTPYRTSTGKFSSDSTGRKIYSEEFILIGSK
ncbi:MAG: class I SAM-dependent methyltransferase [Spirochaetes bacterium]|nr:class I SAM-dependent methyltransferase [Spirochaetota bacterium]